jgi:hypothetical protein
MVDVKWPIFVSSRPSTSTEPNRLPHEFVRLIHVRSNIHRHDVSSQYPKRKRQYVKPRSKETSERNVTQLADYSHVSPVPAFRVTKSDDLQTYPTSVTLACTRTKQDEFLDWHGATHTSV